MSVVFERERAGIWVANVRGPLDVQVAHSLITILREMGPSESIVIDVWNVQEFHDAAIGLLATAMRRGDSAQAQVEGLSERQAKIFRYFGVDPHCAWVKRLPTRDIAGPESPATVEHL